MASWLKLGVATLVAMAISGVVTVHVRRLRAAPLPMPTPAPQLEMARVLASTKSVATGAELREGDVIVREVPKSWVTASLVMPETLPQVLGSRVRAPLEPSEPLRWALLAGGARPIAEACAEEVGAPKAEAETLQALRRAP
jgi:Flp pilus assembly protein CpaB